MAEREDHRRIPLRSRPRGDELHDFRIVVYDNVLAEGGDIFDVFVTACLGRSTPDDLPALGRVNRSLDPVRVELIRLLNFIHLRRGGNRNRFLRCRFLERIGTIPEVEAFVERATVALAVEP